MKDGFPFKSSTEIFAPNHHHFAATNGFSKDEQEGLHQQIGVNTNSNSGLSRKASMNSSGEEFLVNNLTSYKELWTRVKGSSLMQWSGHLKKVHWMNNRAPPGRAYTPTEIEHVANVITHGIWVVPAIYAGLQLVWLSDNSSEKIAAFIYGTALTMLFAISTFFHSVHYCNRNRQLKDVLHRCDRAMIYIFIAGSYYPWLSLSPPVHPTILFATKWLVWLLAGAGILYQQLYHERYKCLETCLYLVMGMGPSLVIIMCGHEFSGMSELKLGGLLYILGVGFFKADGKIPCAHAIWHLFVVVAASIHYFAILNHLYS